MGKRHGTSRPVLVRGYRPAMEAFGITGWVDPTLRHDTSSVPETGDAATLAGSFDFWW